MYSLKKKQKKKLIYVKTTRELVVGLKHETIAKLHKKKDQFDQILDESKENQRKIGKGK